MAFLKQADFARLTDKTPAYINIYVGRGKLTKRGDGLFDTTDFLNSEFIKKNTVDKVKEVEPTIEPAKKVIKASEQTTETHTYSIDRELKELDLAKKKKELEKLEIEISRRKGELVPVDLIKGLVARFGTNFVQKFRDASERLSDELSHSLGASREQQGKFKSKLIDSINFSITEVIEITESELENIEKDYNAVK